jgi:hypothetical protein
LNGYTNEGFILGHTVGRQGRGYTLKSTYWFSPRNTATLGYRHVKVNHDFLLGGYIDDYFIKSKWQIREEWNVEGGVQYEHWRYPLVAVNQQTNISTTVGVVFTPKWTIWKK